MYRVWVRWQDGSSDHMDLWYRGIAEWIVESEILAGNAAGMVFHPELAV